LLEKSIRFLKRRVENKFCQDVLPAFDFGVPLDTDSDFIQRHFIISSLNRHNLWELIIIDGSSEGPGYVFFDGKWWRVLPGSGVFVPKGYSHAWSSGKNTFKMLWVYGGSRDEAGRIFDVPEAEGRPITPEEEKNARLWTGERA
jgi:hypothetical protein